MSSLAFLKNRDENVTRLKDAAFLHKCALQIARHFLTKSSNPDRLKSTANLAGWGRLGGDRGSTQVGPRRFLRLPYVV